MGRIFGYSGEIHNDDLVDIGLSGFFNSDQAMDDLLGTLQSSVDSFVASEIGKIAFAKVLDLSRETFNGKDDDYFEALYEALGYLPSTTVYLERDRGDLIQKIDERIKNKQGIDITELEKMVKMILSFLIKSCVNLN
jgi:hypothetical protein